MEGYGFTLNSWARLLKPEADGGCFNGIFSPSDGFIELYGFLNCWQGDGLIKYAKSLNHEIGHSLSLEHSSYCQNQCRGIDLDPEQECGPNCPSMATCEPETNPSQIDCDGTGVTIPHCTWNFGNNLMQQGAGLNALTPCQWEIAYNFAFASDSPIYVFGGECEGDGPPIVIPSNTEKSWDYPRSVKGDVIIEPNATLYVNCLVLMGPGKKFHVKRGGKLVVQSATIRAWCSDERWGGIWIEGNAEEEQPDYDASVDTYDDNLAGVVVLQSAHLEGANTAVVTRHPNDLDNWDYFGGLVFAANSDFIGNKRAVEFMLYKRPNKSYFYDNLFDGLSNSVSMGVTIWQCHGIVFDYNIFTGITGNGPFNLIQCNIFGDVYRMHVLSGRDNSGLLILNNDFNHVPLMADVFLSGMSSNPARIDPIREERASPPTIVSALRLKPFAPAIRSRSITTSTRTCNRISRIVRTCRRRMEILG